MRFTRTSTCACAVLLVLFCVMNAPTLGSANNNPTSGWFGLVTSKGGNRTMQLVLQYRF